MSRVEQKFKELFGKVPNEHQITKLFQLLIICDGITVSSYIQVDLEGNSTKQYIMETHDYWFSDGYSDEGEELVDNYSSAGSYEDCVMDLCNMIHEDFGTNHDIYSIYEDVLKILEE